MSGTRTSDRGHLSIGEVLNLLQDDFPDITISKIRFLESQGLLDPERTPSGYRKFYEADITRLRWILTQQREHFLPLKVIKDRLDDGSFADDDLGGPIDADITLHGVPSPVSGTVGDFAPAGGSPGSTIDPGADPTTGAGADPVVEVDGEGAASGLATVSSLRPAPGDATTVDAARSASTTVSTTGSVTGTPTPMVAGREPRSDREVSMPDATRRPASDPAHGGHDLFDAGATSVSLTVEELGRATGLTARQIGELERFGLIESDQLGATARYDEEALVVARVAGQMLGQGVEVRHLRMFKLAAEREVAFYEQLVLPVLKQRDPRARQEALDSLRVLAAGGDALRAAMLRSALRHLVSQG